MVYSKPILSIFIFCICFVFDSVFAADCSNWITAANVGGMIKYDPAVMAIADNQLLISAIGTDNALWINKFDPVANRNEWSTLNGVLTSGTNMAAGQNGNIAVSALGTDNIVWQRIYDGSGAWGEWQNTGLSNFPGIGPNQANAGGSVYRVVKLSDNSLAVEKCAPAVIANNLDAGGFAGESFVWDYSLYAPAGSVLASTNDPEHISWNGLTATIKYDAAGDRNVNFIFKDAGGTTAATGIGRMRIVARNDAYWKQKPRIGWASEFVRNNFMDGVIDWSKTDQAANALNINTITYLGNWGGFGQLPDVLPATSLKVWVILERNLSGTGAGVGPYGEDFEKWAEELAELSLKYPNLVAFQIDDTEPYLSTKLTADRLKSIMQSKNRINPNFRFLPVLYMPDSRIDSREIDHFKTLQRQYLGEGATVWYYDAAYGNFDVSTISAGLNQTSSIFGSIPYIGGTYPIIYNSNGTSFYSETKISQLLNPFLSNSNGIGVFNVPLWAYDFNNTLKGNVFKQMPCDNPAFQYKLGMSRDYPSFVGYYQGVSQQINLPENITQARLSFKTTDTRESSQCTGAARYSFNDLQFKQVLVDGNVIWSYDLCKDGKDANQIDAVSISLIDALKGKKTANIAIRYFDNKRHQYQGSYLYVGDIELSVNNQKINNNWVFSGGIDEKIKKQLTDTFNVVSQAFASYASICQNDCPSAGAKQCNGNGVETCAMSGGCLKWDAAVACGVNQACKSGVCIAAQSSGSGDGGGGAAAINTPAKPEIKSAVKMTRAEILAKINEIVALITKLKAQLAAITGKSVYSCTQITKNLYYARQNDAAQVKCLQEVLKSQGYALTISGNYDLATKNAVARFQQKYASEILVPYGLKYGSGNVGNATMAKINVFIIKLH